MQPGLSGWRGRAGALATSLCVLAAACGTETGVLVEITRDDTVPAEIDRLVLYVGTSFDAAYPGNFVDSEPEKDVAMAGRDLAGSPYRLLLRPGGSDGGVMVVALAMVGDQPVGFGSLDGAVPFMDGQVSRWEIVLRGEMPAGFGVSESCLSFLGADGQPITIGRYPDKDCDGHTSDAGDCDDLNPAVNPGATDVCENGLDEDCDSAVDEDVDDDADGVTTCSGDCDDRSEAVHPGATETCDGLDNDCSGACDDGFDDDGDHYTQCGSKIFGDGTCSPVDETLIDCDDGDPASYPWAEETCDGKDNDCDGVCDGDPALDADGDLYTECGSIVGVCGLQAEYGDCAPADGEIHPGATEQCNGVDDNCDGNFLETAPCFGRDPVEAGCYLGTRTCDEEAGGTWTGACQVEPTDGTAVDPATCDRYDQCVEQGDDDPYTCALEGSGGITACTIGYHVGDGAQCVRREVVLPAGIVSPCTWRVVGGMQQGGYSVGLLSAEQPGTPTAEIAECAPILRVTAVLVPPPPQIVVLRREAGGGSEELTLQLERLDTDTCNPPDGLTCDGLPAP